MAVALLLLSGSFNFVVIGGVVGVFETEPVDEREEQLTIIELTEPAPEPKLEPVELEEEVEEEELDKPFELIEKKKEPEPEPEPEPPKPEPEPEPEEIPEEPPQELEELPPDMKMVEQLDELDDNETNDDADFLSNIDRKVLDQTQADITNLREDAREAKASQVEPSENPERGTAAEELIAETETQRSAKAKQAPDVKPELEEMRPEQNDDEPDSLLATRALEPLEHSEAMEAQEDLAIEADDGVVQTAQAESATVLPRDQRAKIMRRDPQYKFKLSRNEMDALYGQDQNAAPNVESLELSKNEGMWDNAREAYQSPLENFVPEVQPGNQTALNTRKHPFARYIATMHRGIHDAWAFGYLASLENHPQSHPLNDLNLWTRVEIVLNANGTIDKVRTVHHSGNSSFDAAAREIVMATGPYPNPPKAIRSGNGKIYMHWAFHRNERACGTFGASPFILDNAGAGDVPSPHTEIHIHGGGSNEEHTRSLVRNKPSQPGPQPRPGQDPELRRGGQGPGVIGLSPSSEGPSRPSPSAEPNVPGAVARRQAPVPGAGAGAGAGGTGGGGGAPGGTGSPGAGSGTGGASPGAGTPRAADHGNQVSLSGRNAGTRPSGGSDPEAKPQGKPPSEDTNTAEGEVDPIAGKIAQNWARAFSKGEIVTMLNRSALPFNSGERVAARSKDELQGLLEALSEEVAGKPAKVTGTYTAAGLRRKFGSVPAGIEEGEGKLYSVVEVGGDVVILMLQKRYGSWRVTGMTR